MAEATQASEATEKSSPWKKRLVIVLGAVLSAVVVFLILGAVSETLKTPGMGTASATDLNVGVVIGTSLFVSLLGWALLALLEKMSTKGGTIWTVIAVVFFLFSLGGPFAGTGITTGNRISLAILHVAVAIVLIPFLPRAKRG